jgi:hypothetical protein
MYDRLAGDLNLMALDWLDDRRVPRNKVQYCTVLVLLVGAMLT